MSIDRWMDKAVVVYIHIGILLSLRKEHIWISSDEVDEPRTYYTKWSESEREREILYSSRRHMSLGVCDELSTPGVGDEQGGLACCNSWGRKESDTTERLNWTGQWSENFSIRNMFQYLFKTFLLILLGLYSKVELLGHRLWFFLWSCMDVSLSELREMVMNREAWHATIHGVAKSRTLLSDWTELIKDNKKGQ